MLFYPSSIFWKPLRVLLFLLLFYSSSFESCLRGNMIIHPSILSHFSCVQLSATLWTKACQASLSMGFSMQEYWSGLPCPRPGDLPHPGIKPASLTSPALAGRLFTTSAAWETHSFNYVKVKPVCIKCVQTLPGELFVTSYNKIYFLIKRVVLATWK